MKAAILTIGNELISGRTQDTNSSFIAREFQRQGWQVKGLMSVGDNDDDIKAGLDYLLGIADCLVVTGGLGPTADDITAAAIARAFGLELEIDEDVLQHIREKMVGRNLVWTPNNARQACFPAGAEKIINKVGMAWGFYLKKDGKIIAVIPGVPLEAENMLIEGVIPVFRREYSDNMHVQSRSIKLAGISESSVDQALDGISFADLGVSIGYYPHFPELELVLTARDEHCEKAAARIARAEGEIVKKLSRHIFAYDQDTLEDVVAGLLTGKKLQLALAESCTGGLIADRLTNVPGSSVFLERGVVTYSNEAKVELLGVPVEIIRKYGAVSRQTAVLMAEGVVRLAGTNLGLAVTGIAGPGGGTPEKPVGTVYIALADGKKTYCRHFVFSWDRRRNKILTSQWALLILRSYLTGEIDYEQQ